MEKHPKTYKLDYSVQKTYPFKMTVYGEKSKLKELVDVLTMKDRKGRFLGYVIPNSISVRYGNGCCHITGKQYAAMAITFLNVFGLSWYDCPVVNAEMEGISEGGEKIVLNTPTCIENLCKEMNITVILVGMHCLGDLSDKDAEKIYTGIVIKNEHKGELRGYGTTRK